MRAGSSKKDSHSTLYGQDLTKIPTKHAGKYGKAVVVFRLKRRNSLSSVASSSMATDCIHTFQNKVQAVKVSYNNGIVRIVRCDENV